jgi:hypothetical protein
MLLHRLLSWTRSKGRGLPLPQIEPGVVISKRLKELLPVESPTIGGTTSMESHNADDEREMNREKFGT